MSRGSDYKPQFCRCQELEERIEQLEEKLQGLSKYCTDTKHILNEHRWKVYDRIEKKFQELKEEIHDLKIDQVKKDWGIFEKDPRLQRYDELQHDLQQGKIDFAEFLELLPDSETPKMKEPDYLQAGDQWRDSEGNEYVLSHFNGLYVRHFVLLDRNTGRPKGSIEFHRAAKSDIDWVANNEVSRVSLGITNNMTKTK